jgi:NhaP-type Na+/H+ or K+/H+ antiporter
MTSASWSAFAGVLLVLMALSTTLLSRLPLSTSMLYLAVGAATSPLWLGVTSLSFVDHVEAIEGLAEVVVLLSLFGSGLKMSAGLQDGRWRPPLRLATLSMLVTVGLVTAAGVAWLGLPLGVALLLGGILAPTDPVLASEVQLADPQDRDRLRYALTGEAGLNDGSSFPFVLLGLGLLGLHDLGTGGWRWIALDVVWAVGGGVAVGAALGTAVGKLVLHLRRTHQEAVGLDNFLALGLIGLAYGLSGLVGAYGFLAVFAAGVALRRLETSEAPAADASKESNPDDTDRPPSEAAATVAAAHADPAADADALAVDPERAPAFMAHAVLTFNEQVERIAEVVAVVVVGMLLWTVDWSRVEWWFVAGLLLVVRPLSVALGLAGSRQPVSQRALIGWFGIRGIGSLYYVAYALSHGVSGSAAETLLAFTLATVATSIVVHGVSVTPLMGLYERRKSRTGA